MDTLELVKRISLPRLDQALSAIFRHMVTVVAAPSGYGKTTAVREYLSSQNVEVFWLKLFWDQDAESCFWAEFLHGVGKAMPSAAKRLERVGFPQTVSDCGKIADILEDLSGDRPVALVLDNYDQIENPKLDKTLQVLMEQLPDRFRLIMICRRQPQFYLHNYVHASRCHLIDKEILRLETSEVAALAETMECQFSQQEIQWLAEYTGGWVSFLCFLLSNARRKGLNRYYFSQLSARIFTSVAKETLIGQELDMLTVLAQVGEFTLDQAAFLLGMDKRGRLEELLERLSVETVFLGKNNEQYVIAGAAQEFLKAEELKSESPLVRMGEQNLVRYYLNSHAPGAAIQLLYNRGDLEGILRALEEHTMEKISREESKMLLQSFQNMDFALLSAYPVATIQLAFLMLKTKTHRTAGKNLLLQLKDYTKRVKHPVYSQEYILGQIDLALSSNEDERLRASSLIRLAREQAHNQMTRPTPWIVPNLLCGFHHTTGSMWTEVETFKNLCAEEKIWDEEFSNYSAAVNCADILQAEYYLEIGDIGKAMYYSLEGIPADGKQYNSLLSLCAIFILAKASLFNGEWDKARSLLKKLAVEPEGPQSDRLGNMVDVCKGYVYACMGEWDQIPDWLRAREEESLRLCQYSSYAYIIRAKELEGRGDFLEFELISKEWETTIRTSQNLLAEIHYHVQKAISAKVLYGMSAAISELNTAFSLALPDDIVAPFVENGKALIPILRYAAENQLLYLPEQYKEKLNKLLSSFLQRPVDISGKGNALTRREMEILQLLNQGLNYSEIADCLTISKFTVRKHIQNIYAKLNVSDRVNALISAKQLFLLDQQID